MDKKPLRLFTVILISVSFGSCAPAVNMSSIASLLGITSDVVSITNGIADLTTKYGIKKLNLPKFIKDHDIDINNKPAAKQRIRQLDAEMQDSILECSYRVGGANRHLERIECLEAKGRWDRNDIIYMVCKHGI